MFLNISPLEAIAMSLEPLGPVMTQKEASHISS
jgi:hypothetical protein